MKTDSKAKTDQRSIISYEQHSCCPVCGSQHFTVGTERSELLQPAALPREKIHTQANVAFTPALCENCGLAFNLNGLSEEARLSIAQRNYAFIKPSKGVGATNYDTYINEVRKHLSSHDDRILEIGGYDGHLLRELSKDGYTNLTLIDPSSQTQDADKALEHVHTIEGYFPSDDPVYQTRTSSACCAKNESGSCGCASGEMRLYKVVAAKDVLQLMPDPLSFVRCINDVLEIGGIAVLTSVPLHEMHSLQCIHLGINAYRYIAIHSGFKLIDTYKHPENSYAVYVLRKELDMMTEPDQVAAFANSSNFDHANFTAEQDKQRKLIMTNSSIGQSASSYLNRRVAYHATLGHEIVLYGTGVYTFDILRALRTDVRSFALRLVNSSEEQNGYWYMLPDGSTLPVEYAKRALYGRTISLLILGIKSPLFKAEIMSLLASINCRCEEILYLPDYDK